jgi:hypothetical protein
VRIKLTETQIRQLMPFFDRVRSAAAIGSPGMLVAQIRHSQIYQTYWMKPGFLEHQHAKLISEKGQTSIPGDTQQHSEGQKP